MPLVLAALAALAASDSPLRQMAISPCDWLGVVGVVAGSWGSVNNDEDAGVTPVPPLFGFSGCNCDNRSTAAEAARPANTMAQSLNDRTKPRPDGSDHFASPVPGSEGLKYNAF